MSLLPVRKKTTKHADRMEDDDAEIFITVGELKSLGRDCAVRALKEADVPIHPPGLFEGEGDELEERGGREKLSRIWANPRRWDERYDKQTVRVARAICGVGGESWEQVLHDLRTRAVLSGATGDGSGGAYLIPQEMREQVLVKAMELSDILPAVKHIEVKETEGKLPAATRVTSYWLAESAAITRSDVTASKGDWKLNSLKALSLITSEMSEDSSRVDLVDMISTLMAESISEEMDKVVAAGSGTNRPEGIYNAGAGPLSDSLDTYSFGGAITYDGLVGLIYGLPRKYRKGGVFLGADQHLASIRGLKDGNDRPLFTPAVEDEPPLVLGRKYLVSDEVPSGYLMFGNPERYFLFHKTGFPIRIEVLDSGTSGSDNLLTEDKRAVRAVVRADGFLSLPESWIRGSGIS